MPLLLLALAAPAHASSILDQVYAAAGYTAQDLCTRTNLTGDDPERVRRAYVDPEVQPFPSLSTVSILPGDRVSAAAVVPGHVDRRTSIFRRGLGCTVVPPGATIAGVRAQVFDLVADPLPDARPWPEGEGPVDTVVSPELAAALVRAADAAFGQKPTSPGERSDATAFVVAKDGRLVYERYRDGLDREDPQLGWSMTKSLTGMLAGIFSGDGTVAPDAPVGLAAWEGTPKAAITWRNLLTMSPGLEWAEDYGDVSDVSQQLFAQPDQVAWIAKKPLVDAPGARFNYSTGATTLAMGRLEEIAGGPQAIYDAYQRRLFAPLGIRHGVIQPDAVGTPVGGAYGVLRPVDWARLGELMARGGVWHDQVVIPAAWVTFMRTPSAAEPGYGGSVWFPSMLGEEATRLPLPPDTFFFWGHLGQFTIISPSAHLVMVRMGVTHDPTDTLPLRVLLPAFAELAAIR